LQESAAEFVRDSDFQGRGRYRRIAGIGPAYEILSVRDATVRIRFVDEDAEHDYPRGDAEMDPPA
jgi:hypothetical protein